MKKLIYLAILALIPSSFLLANHGDRAIEGYWYSPGANKEIKIERRKYGLRIKGLSSNRKFRPIGHRTFSNFDGTKIQFKDRGVVKVTQKRRRGWGRTKVTIRHFYREGRGFRNDRFDDRGFDNGYYGSDDHWSGDYSSEVRTRRRLSPTRIRTTIVGEWKTQGLDHNIRVVISGTSAGIKAKFRNSDNWIFYAQSGSNPRMFEDRRGNKYVLSGSNSLEWIGFDGKQFNLVRRD